MTHTFPAYDPDQPSTGAAFIAGAQQFLELYTAARTPRQVADHEWPVIASLLDKLDALRAPVEPVGLALAGGVLELTAPESAMLTP